MWKLLIYILMREKSSFVRAIKRGNKTYVITIKEYIPIDEQLKKWECALKADVSQST